jgi:hypothetical protein
MLGRSRRSSPPPAASIGWKSEHAEAKRTLACAKLEAARTEWELVHIIGLQGMRSHWHIPRPNMRRQRECDRRGFAVLLAPTNLTAAVNDLSFEPDSVAQRPLRHRASNLPPDIMRWVGPAYSASDR